MSYLLRTCRLIFLPGLVAAGIGGAGCSSSSGPGTVPSEAGKDSGGFHHIVPDAGSGEGGPGDAMEGGGDESHGYPCTPGPVDLAKLTTHHAPGKGCSPAQLAAVTNGCFAPGSSNSGCAAVQSSAADVSCVDCVYTQASAPEWGPILLVTPPGGAMNLLVLPPNFGTCVAAADPSPAGQLCGKDLEELLQCEIEACVPRCLVKGVDDITGRQALFGTLVDGNLQGGCFQAADASVCATLFNASNTDCSSAVVAGTAGKCFQLGTVSGIEQMFSEYCGGYVDGGAGDARAD